MIVNQLQLAEDQREIMQRITPGFPVSVYQTDFSAKPYKSVIWHWHEDFQFCWVYRGTVHFQVVDQSYTLPKDSGIFINCRLAHTAEPLSPDAAYYCVDTHPDLICPDAESVVYKQMVEPFIQSTSSPVFIFSDDTPEGIAVLSSLKRIFTLFNQDGLLGRELFIQSEILRLWPSILKRAQNAGSPVSALGNERIKKDCHLYRRTLRRKNHPSFYRCSDFPLTRRVQPVFQKNHRHVPLCLYQPIPYQKRAWIFCPIPNLPLPK